MDKLELRVAVERALRSAQISGMKFMNHGDLSIAEDVIQNQANKLISEIVEDQSWEKHEHPELFQEVN